MIKAIPLLFGLWLIPAPAAAVKEPPCFWWSESAMDFIPLKCTSLFDAYVRPGYKPRKDPALATSK